MIGQHADADRVARCALDEERRHRRIRRDRRVPVLGDDRRDAGAVVREREVDHDVEALNDDVAGAEPERCRLPYTREAGRQDPLDPADALATSRDGPVPRGPRVRRGDVGLARRLADEVPRRVRRRDRQHDQQADHRNHERHDAELLQSHNLPFPEHPWWLLHQGIRPRRAFTSFLASVRNRNFR